MRTSNECKQVLKAFFEVKKELRPLVKDSSNPFFKSKYLELSDILIDVEPILHNHGLFLTQGTLIKEGKQLVISRITHAESSEYIESEFIADPNSNDSQKLGSATSYARRYGLQALLSLNAIDDDGNAASDKKVDNKQANVSKGGFNKPAVSAEAVKSADQDVKGNAAEVAAPVAAAPAPRGGSFGKRIQQ